MSGMSTDSSEATMEPLFHRDGDRLVPTARTVSVWDPDALRGGAIAGVLLYEIERSYLEPEYQLARVTFDMFRRAPLVPVSVEARVVREGNRIRVLDAVLRADDLEVARASAVLLRRATAPEGNVWSPPVWDVPGPRTLDGSFEGGRPAIWERRFIGAPPTPGVPRAVAPQRAWLRVPGNFVDTEISSPLVRAAMAADTANPYANAGDRGLNYINADATLYMHRDPVGEWIGVEVTAHQAAEGIAVGECALYDLDGPFGRTTVCSISNRMRP